MTLEKLVVGLTGNIASGKSSVSSKLNELGAYVIDADRVVHELYSKSFMLKYRLVRAFGFSVLDRKLDIDRKELGKIVFGDKKKMGQLKDIVWPYVHREVDNRIRKSEGVIVVEAALLLDSRIRESVDYVVVVATEKSIRKERLKTRELNTRGISLSNDEADKRLASQPSTESLVKKADYVVYNNSTIEELEKETKNLWSELLRIKSQ